jgi:small ligand-binding sensory domain FIST
MGCAGAGVLTSDGEVEGESAVGVLVASGGEIKTWPFLLRDSESSDEWHDVETQLRETSGQVLITLLGALGEPSLDVLARMTRMAPGARVAGGGAVGGGDGGDVWLDDRVVTGGTAGMLVGGSVRAAVGVAHGCRPVGHLMTITRARGNLIFELDGMPAFEPFAKLCREPLLADLRRAAAFVFAGLPTGSGGRADYLVRSFVGFDPTAGVLAISEPVREGQALTFLVREAQGARRDLEAMLAEVQQELAGARPAFGLYFNCAGRGSGLYGVADHDVAFIQRTLGEFPLLGFFSAAEIAPLAPAPAIEMYSGVLVVFGEVALA